MFGKRPEIKQFNIIFRHEAKNPVVEFFEDVLIVCDRVLLV